MNNRANASANAPRSLATAIEDIVPAGMELYGSTTVARRGGPFLFFGSQTPADLETGRLVRGFRDLPADVKRQFATGIILTDAPDDRILAQTWRLFTNLDQMLRGCGASLADIVHQRIFLREMRDVPAVERVLRALLPGEWPSTALIGATSDGVDPDIQIQADFIVLAPDAGLDRETVRLPELDHLAAPYPLATRAGRYVFTTPLAGVDPETGALVQRLAQLRPEEREYAEPPYSPDQEASVAQHMMIFRHIGAILHSLGGTLQGQVRMNGWLRIPFQEFGPLAKVRRRMFSGPGMQVPATSFPMAGVRTRDALFEWQTIALLPPLHEGDPRKTIAMPQHPLAPYQVPALLAGPYLFTAGEVAIDTAVPRVIRTFADFEAAGRHMRYGRVHAESPVMAQALFVYEKLASYLQAHNLGMDRAVQQTVYMVDASHYPAVERVASLFYGPRLPPTTIVPIRGVSPFREALLEIEVTAVA